jgi:type I restriction enzyme, S subunit
VVCDRYPQWFVHQQLDLALPFFQEVAAGKATTMGHIKREHLTQVAVVLPPDEAIQAAEPIFAPLYARVHNNEREILSLEVLRDTLLPQLLSGTVRLRAAERTVAAAV